MAKNVVEQIKLAQGEMGKIETQLQGLAKVSVRTMQLDVEAIPEVLQTRTAPLEEVRVDLYKGGRRLFRRRWKTLLMDRYGG